MEIIRKGEKDKYTPYKICENNGRYYLSFKDGQGVRHEIEIKKDSFNMLNRFELDDLSILNEWNRHIEHFEQTVQSMNRRACAKAESVEEVVLRSLTTEYRSSNTFLLLCESMSHISGCAMICRTNYSTRSE